MMRQLAPPQPQLFPEVSFRSDMMPIDFMLGLSSVASNWATVGLSEIRKAKYVMLPAVEPPVQTTVNRGARGPMLCPVATSATGAAQVTLESSAATEEGANSIVRIETAIAAKAAAMIFDMISAPNFRSNMLLIDKDSHNTFVRTSVNTFVQPIIHVEVAGALQPSALG